MVTDNSGKLFAIVHLAWNREANPFWPYSIALRTLEELKAELREWADGLEW